MDTTGDSFYPMDAAFASSAAAADPGFQVFPRGPAPRGPPARLGLAAAIVPAAPLGEGQPSAVFGIQRRLYEAEVEKDNFRIQFRSIMTKFQAQDNWWRASVMETMNQVIAGMSQNHQFEFEARQQW